MIVVYLKWKRAKEYKNLYLKNLADQTIICKELKFSGYIWLSELASNWIILQHF